MAENNKSYIVSQYDGIDMASLIGGPLYACIEAEARMAIKTFEFIKSVGFKENNDNENKYLTLETCNFEFNKYSKDETSGDERVDKLALNLPLLSLVNIPSFSIEEANIIFDMEVKEVTKHKDTFENKTGIDSKTSFSLFGIKEELTITGNISSYKENTRDTDTSSKYHVEVKAKSKPISEGLSRVLDILNELIVPSNANNKPSIINE